MAVGAEDATRTRFFDEPAKGVPAARAVMVDMEPKVSQNLPAFSLVILWRLLLPLLLALTAFINCRPPPAPQGDYVCSRRGQTLWGVAVPAQAAFLP